MDWNKALPSVLAIAGVEKTSGILKKASNFPASSEPRCGISWPLTFKEKNMSEK
jgi:hypothetical protein